MPPSRPSSSFGSPRSAKSTAKPAANKGRSAAPDSSPEPEPPSPPDQEPAAPKTAEPLPPAAAEPALPPPAGPSPFIEALAELLTSRGLPIPDGLMGAPEAAYAAQGAGAVATLARLNDNDLAHRASKVAGWQARQNERAVQAWDGSPLVREVRRRGLPEPERPAKVAGVAFSLKKPLAEWTDEELTEAVDAWAQLGNA